jgi:hypothetical protein
MIFTSCLNIEPNQTGEDQVIRMTEREMNMSVDQWNKRWEALEIACKKNGSSDRWDVGKGHGYLLGV